MKPCTVLCNKWLFCKPNDVLRYVAAAKRFQRVICSTMRSPYILWLCKGAKRLPLSLRPGGGGIFCTDMVQTINYIHQDGFVGKSARGGSGPNRDDNAEALLKHAHESTFLYKELPSGIQAKLARF